MSRYIKPGLESLEDRYCLSATMLQASVQGHTLRLTGNDEWNVVQIVQNDVQDTLEVVYSQLPNSGTQSAQIVNKYVYKSSSITRITVDLGLGNDNFKYSLAPDTDLVNGKDLQVSMGDGMDCVTIDTAAMVCNNFPNQIAPPLIDASAGVMTADGIMVNLFDLQNIPAPATRVSTIKTSFNVTLDMGAGDDMVTIRQGDLTGGMKMNMAVSMGDGQDHFWLCNYGTLAKNATLTVNVDGGTGNDDICMGNYADVLGTMNFSAKGGAADDSFYIDLAGLQNGKTTVSIDNRTGNDLITFNALQSPLSTGVVSYVPFK